MFLMYGISGCLQCQINNNACHGNQINALLGKMAVLKCGAVDLHIHTKFLSEINIVEIEKEDTLFIIFPIQFNTIYMVAMSSILATMVYSPAPIFF